jgi:hypothetical protein
MGEDSPGSPHRPLTVASCLHRAVYEQKKSGPAAASAEMMRVQLPGSGAIPLLYSLFLTDKAFPAWEPEPATGAASTDRIPATQASTAAPPRPRSATVRNGTENRPMDGTLSPKPVTVAYANRRGRVTVMGQPSGLVTRFTTRIPPGLRRSGPRRHINQPDRDVPSRSPTVPSSASAPVRRAKAGPP